MHAKFSPKLQYHDSFRLILCGQTHSDETLQLCVFSVSLFVCSCGLTVWLSGKSILISL